MNTSGDTGRRWGKMIAAYVAGSSLSVVADRFGIGASTLQRELVKRGIGRRPPSRQPQFDTTRFRDMATEEEAYWLGVLYTDGCLDERENRVILSLAATDADHVGNFARFLGSARSPRLDTRGKVAQSSPGAYGCSPMSRFALRSAELADNLKRQGLHARKSWTITPWRGPYRLMRHFWRGCMDGDGMLTSTTPGNRRPRIAFWGNEAMVRGFSGFVHTNLGWAGRIRSRQATGEAAKSESLRLFSVVWTGWGRCREIAHLLYGGACVSLGRKQAVAAVLMSCEAPRAVAIPAPLVTRSGSPGDD